MGLGAQLTRSHRQKNNSVLRHLSPDMALSIVTFPRHRTSIARNFNGTCQLFAYSASKADQANTVETQWYRGAENQYAEGKEHKSGVNEDMKRCTTGLRFNRAYSGDSRLAISHTSALDY